jgi:riboflavin kinase / FMN adenylyltransferase
MPHIEPVFHGHEPHPSWVGCAVALGNFDGVHLGHRELLGRLRQMADHHGAPALAVTFHPHPAEVLGNMQPRRLMPIEDRIKALHAAGMDAVWVVPFTRELATVTAEQYLEETLLGQLKMCGFVAGPDTRFGARRAGGADLLREYARRVGYDLAVLEPFELNGERVSSTAIRNLLESGDMSRVAAWLGHPYRLKGKVIHGMKIGRKLGFPTANLEVGRDILIPATGIYVVRVRMGLDAEHAPPLDGVANVGNRPTLDAGPLSVEAHLFNVDEDLYGQPITIELLLRLRDEEKYDSVAELKVAIADDVQMAKAWLADDRRPSN